MNRPLPRTIAEYLDDLRAALRGADPALIQDALYDAEDHLRAELAENPGKSEADVLAKIATTYGAPDEVASIYVDKEVQVQQALRSPPPPPRKTAMGKFFGVAADPRAYAALFYMLLSLATGIFYFVWAVTGVSLSLGLSILIFGLAFAVLFFGTVRVLSLVDRATNGLTFCTGSLGSRPDNDLPAMARRFAERGRVHFMHCRNVRRTGERRFHEVPHPSRFGDVDMRGVLGALRDAGFAGPMRSDHGRMIWGERGRAGYGLHDRALGATYLYGLWEGLQ
jgi:uncharacterized membrane protein